LIFVQNRSRRRLGNFENFTASAARRLRVFLISGGGSEIFKIFTVSAAAAVFFPKKSATVAAQPIGLHLYV
jgi:hypothetical protein